MFIRFGMFVMVYAECNRSILRDRLCIAKCLFEIDLFYRFLISDAGKENFSNCKRKWSYGILITGSVFECIEYSLLIVNR